jgi:hypothetical protein
VSYSSSSASHSSSPATIIVVVLAVVSSSVDLIIPIVPSPSKIIKKVTIYTSALMCVHFMEKLF